MKLDQYYPTYNFKKRDIVLKEFESAQRVAETQSQVFGKLSNILLAAVTIFLSFVLKFNSDSGIIGFKYPITYSIYICGLYAFFGYLLLIYFVELQKTIIINVRKVVVLRKMLDLDYGSLQLVLPRWRIEGASNPFSVKMFSGWFSVTSFPFWIITVSTNIILYISLSRAISFWYWLNILIFALFAFQFRKRLCDNHETVYLLLIKNFASIINLKLIKNFEYVLYRAKLATYELERLKIDISNVKKILIIVEDRKFYNHKGIDLKALSRGFLSIFKYFRYRKGYFRSGGSTLTMQLVRTLFIQARDYNKLLRRKIIEILLAGWLDRQLKKNLILGIYLSSVRFGPGVFGITSASKYWFNGQLKKSFTNEEAFFLVERLSNPNSSYNRNKVEAWAMMVKKEIIPDLDAKKLLSLYEVVIKNGLLKEKAKSNS